MRAYEELFNMRRNPEELAAQAVHELEILAARVSYRDSSVSEIHGEHANLVDAISAL